VVVSCQLMKMCAAIRNQNFLKFVKISNWAMKKLTTESASMPITLLILMPTQSLHRPNSGDKSADTPTETRFDLQKV